MELGILVGVVVECGRWDWEFEVFMEMLYLYFVNIICFKFSGEMKNLRVNKLYCNRM